MPVSSETKAVAVLMSRICHRFQEVPSSGLLLWSLPLAPPLFTLPGEVSAKHSALQIPYIGKESPPPLSLGDILTSLLLCMQIRHPTIQSCGSLFHKCPSSGGRAGTSGEESGHQSSAWLSTGTAQGACSRANTEAQVGD